MADLGQRFDVAVLGGGIMGLSIADALLSRGRRVVLVERFELGHGRGGSHGDGRIFRFSYPEREYVELARLALTGWRELEGRSGERLLDLTGNLDCGPAGGAALAAIEANLAAAGLRAERLSPAEVAARFPQLALDPDQEALLQGNGGVVLAERALTALAREIARRGGTVLEGVCALGLEVSERALTVELSNGPSITAGAVVLAAGSWSRALGAALGLALPLRVTREQIAYFAARDGIDHGPGRLPTVIDYAELTRPFYALPRIRVPGVKVGWHHAGVPIDGPDSPSEVDAENLAALGAFVHRRFPHLEPRPFEVATCLYNSTPDHHFVLDRHPSEPRIVIATGFSGHGFKFGPAVGVVAAALALDEPPPLKLELFRLDRFR